MSLGDITALNNIGLVEAIGAIVLFIILGNATSILRWIKDRFTKKKECEDYSKSDIRLIVDSAIKRAITIFNLKEYKTLHEQMLCVEKSTLMIKSIIIDNFQEMKQLKGHKNRGRDIRAYSKIIDFTMEQAKATLKEWIKANHILERSDLEFQVYIKETVKNLLMQVSTIIDREYYSEDFIIDRETLKKNNIAEMTAEISEILSNLLMSIRDIAEEKQKEIHKLEAEEIFDGSNDDEK